MRASARSEMLRQGIEPPEHSRGGLGGLGSRGGSSEEATFRGVGPIRTFAEEHVDSCRLKGSITEVTRKLGVSRGNA